MGASNDSRGTRFASRLPRHLLTCACVCLFGSGCGEAQFVPAPFTPTHVELTYSSDEDLTRLRFRVAVATGAHFEQRNPDGNGFSSLRFDGAAYPSGPYACGDSTCYQLTTRGQVALPSDGIVVRNHQSDYGIFVGQPAVADAPPTPGVDLSLAFLADNGNVRVALTDWLDAPGLSRPFGYTVWPSAAADCTVDATHPDDDDAPDVFAGTSTVAPPTPTSDGDFCVRARSKPSDDGPSVAVVAAVSSHPEVFRRQVVYQPTVEVSPIVWRIITDLEVVDPDRCRAIGAAVHAAFLAAIGATGAESHELAAIDLSPGCQQVDSRSFDGGPVADEAKRWLAENSTDQYQRPVLIYVNNLDTDLPPSLIDSFSAYITSFPDPHVVPLDVAFATGSVLSDVPWDLPMQFVAIEDPQFSSTITAELAALLPFKSQLHFPDTVLPLMSAADLTASSGHPWKVCQASPEITRFAGSEPIPFDDLAPLADPLSPPGYTVTLPVKILVPGRQFASDTAVILYEVCTRYCDHAFVDSAGESFASWSDTDACVKNTAP